MTRPPDRGPLHSGGQGRTADELLEAIVRLLARQVAREHFAAHEDRNRAAPPPLSGLPSPSGQEEDG